MPVLPASTALSHITVLDLSRVRSGPTCVRQLADWGADVIMVEMPLSQQSGDPMGGARDGPDFQNLHRNKRSISLDLKREEGKAAFLRLVDKADVVVENFRPDVKRRLQIDYDTLSKRRPELVYASISGFGQSGPYERRPGFDQIAQGMGGIMSITGEPGRGPMRVGIPIADLTAGLYCAIGVLVALLERDQTGRGQQVSTSLLESQIAMLDFQAARWLVKKEVPEQVGNDHPTMLPTGVFQTADGIINLAVTGAVMWQRFCDAVGAQEMKEDERFKSSAGRLKNRVALNEAINAIFRTKSTADWMKLLSASEVPAGAVNRIDQVFGDEQVKHLKMASKVNSTALAREIEIVRNPVNLERTPSSISRPAPMPGEHTDEVLGEFGFQLSEIEALRAQQII